MFTVLRRLLDQALNLSTTVLGLSYIIISSVYEVLS